MADVQQLQSPLETELDAMRTAWAIIEKLKPETRARVLSWLAHRASPHPGLHHHRMVPPGFGDDVGVL